MAGAPSEPWQRTTVLFHFRKDEENRMDVARRASLCMTLALAAVCGHAAAAEQVQLPPMKGYQQAHQSTDAQGNRITEYVPQGQTVHD